MRLFTGKFTQQIVSYTTIISPMTINVFHQFRGHIATFRHEQSFLFVWHQRDKDDNESSSVVAGGPSLQKVFFLY